MQLGVIGAAAVTLLRLKGNALACRLIGAATATPLPLLRRFSASGRMGKVHCGVFWFHGDIFFNVELLLWCAGQSACTNCASCCINNTYRRSSLFVASLRALSLSKRPSARFCTAHQSVVRVSEIRVESRERVTFSPTSMKRFHDPQQFHSHWTR